MDQISCVIVESRIGKEQSNKVVNNLGSRIDRYDDSRVDEVTK